MSYRNEQLDKQNESGFGECYEDLDTAPAPQQALNFVTEWSWDKPTEEGLYLMCYGDIETRDNVWTADVETIQGQLSFYDPDLREYVSVESLSSSCKYAKLVFSPSEIKELQE
jgi:hypothetical protein